MADKQANIPWKDAWRDEHTGDFDAINPDTDKSSAAYYYVCAHGASNEPCPTHFPPREIPELNDDGTPKVDEHGRQILREQTRPTMPDDWMKTYVAPGPPGPHDAVSLSVTDAPE